MKNYRFPDYCTIEHIDIADIQDGGGSSTIVYKGSCRKELNLLDNRHYRDTSMTATWMVALPIVVKVKYGDKVIVKDEVSDLEGFVTDYETTQIYHTNDEMVKVEVCNGEAYGNDIVGEETRGIHIHCKTNKN